MTASCIDEQVFQVKCQVKGYIKVFHENDDDNNNNLAITIAPLFSKQMS